VAVNETISSSETMMDGDLARYLDVGRSAMKAMALAGVPQSPKAILDLPCGHGRVARHLRAAYPNSTVYVADLDEEGADFCASVLGCTKLTSNEKFDGINFGIQFDLIWVGSLVTHLRDQDTKSFLAFIARHLSPEGVAIVSVHGAFVAGRLLEASFRAAGIYGLDADSTRQVLSGYLSSGYGYAPYPHNAQYGISAAKREWVTAAVTEAGLRVNRQVDHAWDNHQDVFAIGKMSNLHPM
jgi:SAM-dependent methyltransferase